MFAFFGLSTHAQITFVKSYYNSIFYYGRSFTNSGQQTSDGGYIMLNYDLKEIPPYYMTLIKTNADGDTLWTRIYANYFGYSVIQTNDGGYIISGTNQDSTIGRAHVCLIKTNSSGDTLWTKCYGSINNVAGFYGYSVKQTNDNGYIVVGASDSADYGLPDVLLIKTNSIGDTIWTKTYGGSNNDFAVSVELTSDGGYIITGGTSSFGNGRVYLIKTNSMGDILWTKHYGSSGGWDAGYSVKQTSDDGYIIAGIYNQIYYYLIKTNSIGDTLWTKTYFCEVFNVNDSEDEAYNVQKTSEGGYIISGSIYNSSGDSYIGLIKTDSTGDILWTSYYVGRIDGPGTFQQTADGGYIIFGESIIKTDSNGNSGCSEYSLPTTIVSFPTHVSNTATIVKSGCIVNNPSISVESGGDTVTTVCFSAGINEIKTNYYVSLYPNPTYGTFTLSYNSQTPILNSQLKIYDVLGQEVYTQLITDNSSIINLPQLSNGVYFYQLTNNTETYRGKFVKQ